MTTRISGLIGPFGRLTVRTTTGGKPFRPHVHAEFNILANCGGAPLNMRVGDREVALRSGHLMLVSPWELHAPVGGGPGHRTILNLLIDRSWFARLAQGGYPASSLTRFDGTPVLMDAQARQLAGSIADTCLEYEASALTGVTDSVRSLVAWAIDACVREVDGPSPTQSPVVSDARVRRALDYLAARPTEPFSASRTASAAGLSRAQFFRAFKSGLGCPPRYVADAARVNFSVRALVQPELQIADIADSLGFSAPSHFTSFFAEHMGVAPGEYRRSLLLSGL